MRKRSLKEDLPKSFSSKVNFTRTCWLWTAYINPHGYGKYNVRHQKMQRAHRFSWTHFYGEIPEGMFVCHKCDVRNCVNPKHLFLGTNKDNMDDKIAKGRSKSASGEQSGVAKMKNWEVEEIRKTYKLFSRDEFSLKALAKKFRVNPSHVSRIVNNKVRVKENNNGKTG